MENSAEKIGNDLSREMLLKGKRALKKLSSKVCMVSFEDTGKLILPEPLLIHEKIKQKAHKFVPYEVCNGSFGTNLGIHNYCKVCSGCDAPSCEYYIAHQLPATSQYTHSAKDGHEWRDAHIHCLYCSSEFCAVCGCCINPGCAAHGQDKHQLLHGVEAKLAEIDAKIKKLDWNAEVRPKYEVQLPSLTPDLSQSKSNKHWEYKFNGKVVKLLRPSEKTARKILKELEQRRFGCVKKYGVGHKYYLIDYKQYLKLAAYKKKPLGSHYIPINTKQPFIRVLPSLESMLDVVLTAKFKKKKKATSKHKSRKKGKKLQIL